MMPVFAFCVLFVKGTPMAYVFMSVRQAVPEQQSTGRWQKSPR